MSFSPTLAQNQLDVVGQLFFQLLGIVSENPGKKIAGTGLGNHLEMHKTALKECARVHTHTHTHTHTITHPSKKVIVPNSTANTTWIKKLL